MNQQTIFNYVEVSYREYRILKQCEHYISSIERVGSKLAIKMWCSDSGRLPEEIFELGDDISQLIASRIQLISISEHISEFTSLNTLILNDNALTETPLIPHSLVSLSARNCHLTEIPGFPDSLNYIDISYNYLSEIPRLPDSLIELKISGNPLKRFPEFPHSIEYLEMKDTTHLPPMNDLNLQALDISDCQMSEIPMLPPTLRHLNISGNPITEIPSFPPLLTTLNISRTEISHLPEKPPTLRFINRANTPMEHR